MDSEDASLEALYDLEITAQIVFSVPKAGVDVLEKQEKKPDKQAQNKPSK